MTELFSMQTPVVQAAHGGTLERLVVSSGWFAVCDLTRQTCRSDESFSGVTLPTSRRHRLQLLLLLLKSSLFVHDSHERTGFELHRAGLADLRLV